MGGIQNLPLPVLYRANVEGHYLHMRRGARTVPPLIRIIYGDSNWSTRVRCSPEPGRGTWGAGFWCAVI